MRRQWLPEMQLLRHGDDCGMTVELSPLPPGVRAETFTYANGKQETVYRAPFESDGPRLVVEDGAPVLYYMYAAYVFRWREGTTQLDVGHGSIDRHIGLFDGISITGRWSPDRLAGFSQRWATEQFRRFAGGRR